MGQYHVHARTDQAPGSPGIRKIGKLLSASAFPAFAAASSGMHTKIQGNLQLHFTGLVWVWSAAPAPTWTSP